MYVWRACIVEIGEYIAGMHKLAARAAAAALGSLDGGKR